MLTRRRNDDLLRFGLFWPISRTLIPTAYIARQNPVAIDLAAQLQLARELEEAGFDFGLLADGYVPVSDLSTIVGHHDPAMNAAVWAMAILGATSRLGVISTLHPPFIDPIDVAQYGAQLDYASNGRWGWNVTAGYQDAETILFGADGLAPHGERYALAEESVSIVRQLWREDRERVSYRGDYRRVEGNMPGPLPARPGGPAIVNAGASKDGYTLAARHCDYLFAPVVHHVDVARLNSSMAEIGREAGREEFARVLTTLSSFLRDDEQEAQDEWAAIMASIEASPAVNVFTESARKGSESAQDAKNRGGGGLVDDVEGGPGPLVGSPESVADQIIELYRDHGYRGILATVPYWGPGEIPRYGRMFERLEDAGIWRPSAKRDSLW